MLGKRFAEGCAQLLSSAPDVLLLRDRALHTDVVKVDACQQQEHLFTAQRLEDAVTEELVGVVRYPPTVIGTMIGKTLDY